MTTTIRYKYAQPNWPDTVIANIMKIVKENGDDPAFPESISIFPIQDGQPEYEEWKVWSAAGGVTEPHDPIPVRPYRDERLARYPHIHDQLDMLYHDLKNNTTTWVDLITKIKTDYPKPEVKDEVQE